MGWSIKVFLVIAVVLIAVYSFGQDKLPAGGDKVDLPPGVSGGWWGTVQQNIRREEYNISSLPSGSGARFQAPNRAQGFRSYFSEKGVRLVPRTEENPSWEWGLELVGKAEGSRLKAEVKTDGNRIEINRGDIVEWYINDENGLEQGFTVRKPTGNRGKLHIDMKLTGSLRPKFSTDGQVVDFYGKGSLCRERGQAMHYAYATLILNSLFLIVEWQGIFIEGKSRMIKGVMKMETSSS